MLKILQIIQHDFNKLTQQLMCLVNLKNILKEYQNYFFIIGDL